MPHRAADPHGRALEASRAAERAEPRNRRLHAAPSLLHYLPAALAYPACVELAAMVVGVGAALWLGFQALVGLWIGIPLLAGALAYLVEVAARSANGYATPPPYTAEHLVQLPAIGFAALLLLGAAVAGAARADAHPDPRVGVLALAALALALPGALIVLGLERSLLRALDPRRVVPLMFQGGGAYLVIAALTACALRAAPGWLPDAPTAEQLVGGRGGAGVAWTIGALYLALVAAHLLGAAVFLRRDAFGFRPALAPVTEDEGVASSSDEAVARLLALADAEEHHGRHEAAVRLLATESIGSHPPRPWLEALFEGACRRPKPYFAEAAGQRLVAHLCSAQQLNRALEIVVLAAQRWPRFQPAAVADRLRLAQHAFERGDALAFRQLSERLETLDPDGPGFELALLVARWRAERERDAAGARAALGPLLARTAHPAHRRAAALAAALEDQSR